MEQRVDTFLAKRRRPLGPGRAMPMTPDFEALVEWIEEVESTLTQRRSL